MANLRKIVYLTEQQKETLFTNGTITVDGVTVNYNADDLYITPQPTPAPLASPAFTGTPTAPTATTGTNTTQIATTAFVQTEIGNPIVSAQRMDGNLELTHKNNEITSVSLNSIGFTQITDSGFLSDIASAIANFQLGQNPVIETGSISGTVEYTNLFGDFIFDGKAPGLVIISNNIGSLLLFPTNFHVYGPDNFYNSIITFSGECNLINVQTGLVTVRIDICFTLEEDTSTSPSTYNTVYQIRVENPNVPFLPSVSSSDNGKILMVENGAWAAASMSVWQGGNY